MQLTTFMIFANSADALFRGNGSHDEPGWKIGKWTDCDCDTKTHHRSVECHEKECPPQFPKTSRPCEKAEIQMCEDPKSPNGYGPESCFSVFKETDTCIVKTDCEDVDADAFKQFTAGFVCKNDGKNDVKHVFDNKHHKTTFRVKETFHSGVKCDTCLPLVERKVKGSSGAKGGETSKVKIQITGKDGKATASTGTLVRTHKTGGSKMNEEHINSTAPGQGKKAPMRQHAPPHHHANEVQAPQQDQMNIVYEGTYYADTE